MIIDFHTHIFPDTLAERATAALYESAGGIYEPSHNGTLAGLLSTMDAAGVDMSINLPVLTKRSQTTSTNQWAASITSDRMISFGGIYPLSDSYKEDIDFVVSLELKGIKLHAEYQGFTLDDPAMLKVYDYALAQGLIIVHHAGFDPAFPAPFRSNPEMFAKIAKSMQGGVMVAAHLGGHAQWDDVEKYLVGTDIYLDTSMGFEYYSHEQFIRIVENHGADKILFGTDSPWSNATSELKTLQSLPLPASTIEAITGGNAKRLLGL